MADGTEHPPAVAPSFADLIEGLTDAVVVLDATLRPQMWNRTFLRLSGLSHRQVTQKVVDSSTRCCTLYKLDACASGCLARRCLTQDRPLRLDEIAGISPYSKNSTSSQTLIVTTLPLKDSRGAPAGVAMIYRDVTAEARVQQRYKAIVEREKSRSQNLSAQVAERTAELKKSLDDLTTTRLQLLQSEKIRALGELVAGVAHEINNPVNFVLGNMGFLEEHLGHLMDIIESIETEVLTDQQRGAAAAIKEKHDYAYVTADLPHLIAALRSGSTRIAAIVKNLGSYGQKATENQAEFDVVACLQESLTLMKYEMGERVRVEKKYGAERLLTVGNAVNLGQVFVNLFTNALHAIHGPGCISVATALSRGGVDITISDTGAGIPADILPRIFDPFFTTKATGQGTGLGLSISQSIINTMGGTIRAESVVGEGTRFLIWLPLAAAPSSDPSAL